MRHDGRAHDVLRPITIERRYTRPAAGSVLIRSGRTTVLCTAMRRTDRCRPGWSGRAAAGSPPNTACCPAAPARANDATLAKSTAAPPKSNG